MRASMNVVSDFKLRVAMRILLLAALWCVFVITAQDCFAEDGGGQSSVSSSAPSIGKTQQQLEDEFKATLLPKFNSANPSQVQREAAVAAAIEKNKQLQELLKQSSSVAEAGELIAAAVAADPSLLYDDRFGATAGEIVTTQVEDREIITSNFSSCQGSGLGHRLEQMLVEPVMIGMPCVTTLVAPLVSSGVCAKCIPSFWCGCDWLIAPLVDYNFPIAKIDVSEQPYQSKYLEESMVATMAPINDLMLGFGGASAAANNVAIVRAAEAGTMLQQGLPVPRMAPALPDIRDSMAAPMLLPSVVRSTTPDSSRVYTRNMFEPLNFESAQLYWIPHVPVPHFFGSDFPPFLTLTSRSLDISMMASLASSNFMVKMQKFLSPRGMLSCMARNQMTGKTATDLLIPGASAFDPALCLDNVGERFPLTDTRRVSITDRTWRGIAKDLDLWMTLFPEGTRHSFDEEKDTFLVLRNKKFRDESPGCKPLQQMTKRNVDYATANEKEIGSGGENTVEVFARFKGCWGFKGKGSDSGFWTYIVGGPTRLQ